MKRLLQLGFVLGFAGTLAAAYFAPWFEYTRYRSAASVVQNGGRVEQFIVHLPADRIGARRTAGDASGVDGPPVAVEHFKLRDVDGNVIGLAARHAVSLDATDETSWLISIPSRGTIALAASGPNLETIESLLTERGIAAGQTLEQPLSIDQGTPARSLAVTGEFEGIDFELVETWVVTGIDDDGRIRGTLNLNTLARRTT